MEPQVTTPFGQRPMTLAMLATQKLAYDIPPGKAVDKWKLFRALCDARQKLGVTDRALALLNALLSFYPAGELSAENGLVVFPSNAQLSARANGMAEPTIRRHLAILVDAGLIQRKDSANGKRFARRDRSGEIDEAFGFSLAPLVARAEEIELMAEDVVTERLAMQRLRERLTICRRDIAKLIVAGMEEGVPCNWDALSDRYRTLMMDLPRKPEAFRIAELLDGLEALRAEIVKMMEINVKSENTSGNDFQNERHIQNSNTESHPELEPLLETKQAAGPDRNKIIPHEVKSFPLGMVLQACPEISAYGPNGRIANWRELMAAAVVVRSMLGVSPSAYQDACEVMGPENAAMIMACILERAGHINSAGGYLRGLTAKARDGAFSPGPMLMALIRSRPASLSRTG